MNERSSNKLARGSAQHADALGNSDCGREVARWKTMGGEIDSRDKRKGGTRALQEPPEGGNPVHVHGKHGGAGSEEQHANRDCVLRPPQRSTAAPAMIANTAYV